MYVSAQNWALFFLSPNFEDMEQIDIKDISGAIQLTTLINEGCKRKFTLMKEDYIMLKFSLENPIYFKLGSYVECNFGLFEVCDLQKPAFNTNTAGYDYELRLDAYYWKWKNKIFKYTPETAGQEASWNLTAPLDVQAGIVLRNLKALGYTYKGQDFVFSIDSTVENKALLMTYDNINILDACFEMAKKWDCECWVTENIIHFGRCESGDAVIFEIGKNVQEMSQSESRSTYATRIYAFGSTKNIPSDYRPVDETVVVNGVVQKRLMLPEGTPCIDAYPDMTTEEAVEQVVIFDEVYPRRTGIMSDVTTIEVTDKVENEDGTTTEEKWDAYRFRDTGVNFSEKYILPGQELRIRFASGLLNGLEFAVKFNPEGKPEELEDGGWNPEAQLWEIVRNEDYGRPLPGDVLFPQDGDEYVLSGWDSTKITELGLVGAAEQELKEKTEKYAAKSKIDPSTYGCTMMSNDAYREDGVHNFYGIGQKVNLINKAYFENGRQSRVIGFEFNLDYSFDSPVYTVGETAAYSRIGELEEKVESLTLKGQTYTGGGGSGVYVIGSHDSTPATDHNVYSALRSLIMFMRKDTEERTGFLLSLLGGTVIKKYAKFGDFITGVQGGYIGEDARAELEELSLRTMIKSDNFKAGSLGTGFMLKTDKKTGRSYLEVDELFVRIRALFTELEIRKLTYAGGNWIFSAAGMTCERVEELEDVYRCYFSSIDAEKEVENEFRVGDQARCQEFNVKTGTSQNVSNRYYWRLVVGAGDNYIDLSKTDCDSGSDAPKTGDSIVQLGNRSDKSRQNAIIISAYGEGSPSLTQHKGINSYSLKGTEKTRISPETNILTGEFHFETGEDVKDEIDAAKNTANSANSAAIAANKIAEEAKKNADLAKSESEKANSLLADIANDNKLTAQEKQETKKEWDIIVSEKPKNDASADKYGVSKSAYGNAYNALSGYITPLLTSLSTTSDIVGADFRAKFKAYYDARTDLLNAISAKAKELVDAADNKIESVKTELFAVDGKITLAVKTAKEEAISSSKAYTNSEIKVVKDQIALKVDSKTFNALNQKVTEQGSQITLNKNNIEQRVTKTEYSKLGKLFVSSGNNDVGNTGYFTLNGTRYSHGGRGHTIYKINRSNLAVAKVGWYDTYAAGANCTNFVNGLNSVDENHIVVIISDDACSVDGNMAGALKKYGGLGQVFAPIRNSHAFVGIKNIGEGAGLDFVYKDRKAEISSTIVDGTPVGMQNLHVPLIRLTSAETKITQNANEIQQRATKSTVDALTGRVTTAESKITQNANSISLKITASEATNIANNAVNNLQIGGTNLLVNTDFLHNRDYWSGGDVDSSVTLQGRNSLRMITSGLTGDSWRGGEQINTPYLTAKQGDVFTISLFSRTDNISSFDRGASMEIRYYNSSGGRITQSGFNIKPSINNTWTRFAGTGTCPAGTVKVSAVWYNVRNGRIWVNGIKLEVGKKATDWTRSPHDSPTTQDVKSSFTIDTGGISMLGKKLSLTGMVTFNSLASDAQGKINTAQSTANTAKSTAETAKSTADGANSKATTAQNTANTAKSTADSANSKATTAQNTANTAKSTADAAKTAAANAQSRADAAYNKKIELAQLGTTVISGGFIKTSLIKANEIIVSKLSGATGSFKQLQAVDDSGNVKGTLSLDGDRLWYDGDQYQQGAKDGRSLRYYMADAWVRGKFGARTRTTLLVQGSSGYFYPKGVDKTGVYKSFERGTSSDGRIYYKLPCYGSEGDYSGMPVDLIVFNVTSSNQHFYELQLAVTQKVNMINCNNNYTNVLIYCNGNYPGLPGGSVHYAWNVLPFMNPQPTANVLGRGLLFGGSNDNDWR